MESADMKTETSKIEPTTSMVFEISAQFSKDKFVMKFVEAVQCDGNQYTNEFQNARNPKLPKMSKIELLWYLELDRDSFLRH